MNQSSLRPATRTWGVPARSTLKALTAERFRLVPSRGDPVHAVIRDPRARSTTAKETR